MVSYFVFCMFPVCYRLIVSNSSVTDCLERLVSDMTCYVSTGTLNPTHSLTNLKCVCIVNCENWKISRGAQTMCTATNFWRPNQT